MLRDPVSILSEVFIWGSCSSPTTAFCSSVIRAMRSPIAVDALGAKSRRVAGEPEKEVDEGSLWKGRDHCHDDSLAGRCERSAASSHSVADPALCPPPFLLGLPCRH